MKNVNPSNAEVSFIQITRTQIFSKTIETLSCWYSLEGSSRVLSYEYPFARVSVIFQCFFLHHFAFAKLATSSIRVKKTLCYDALNIVNPSNADSGADKSRFWPNRALWGASMKLGTIMVQGMLRKIGRGHRL